MPYLYGLSRWFVLDASDAAISIHLGFSTVYVVLLCLSNFQLFVWDARPAPNSPAHFQCVSFGSDPRLVTTFTLFFLITVYFVPLLVMIFTYSRILAAIVRQSSGFRQCEYSLSFCCCATEHHRGQNEKKKLIQCFICALAVHYSPNVPNTCVMVGADQPSATEQLVLQHSPTTANHSSSVSGNNMDVGTFRCTNASNCGSGGDSGLGHHRHCSRTRSDTLAAFSSSSRSQQRRNTVAARSNLQAETDGNRQQQLAITGNGTCRRQSQLNGAGSGRNGQQQTSPDFRSTHFSRAKARTLRMTVLIVLAFILCWTPNVVLSVW